MHLRQKKGDGTPMIGLTPLIDVVFILLIFFMLASSFLDWRGFEMSVSIRDGSTTRQSDTRSMTIEIDQAGGITLNGEVIAITRLVPMLREQPDGTKFYIRPVNGATLQQLVSVMDALGRGGIVNVDLIE
ncbi:biopolymer transporter ExbD [Thalassospira sp.]|uniref:ExbD/TolR family protein n=1 Tax=Thalassospira sp. TaxID=1912094 RepID=UPI00273386A2|nr:biopolymer transporter ExbD [Thalassospira sp.]MDP2700178.1 biopolymer transporter ExbD [Thalassospira sp.]